MLITDDDDNLVQVLPLIKDGVTTVVYDPVNGNVFPEKRVADEIAKLLSKGQQFSIGGLNEIAYLRWLVKKGEVINLRFIFDGHTIVVDKDGNLEKSPEGFGDFLERYLMELF